MKLTFEQREAIRTFTRWTGMDMLGIEDVYSGKQTFNQFWKYNLDHLKDVHYDIERIIEKAWDYIEFD